MNGKNLDACRFSIGYMVQWHGMLLVAGSKNGIRRLMRANYHKHAKAVQP